MRKQATAHPQSHGYLGCYFGMHILTWQLKPFFNATKSSTFAELALWIHCDAFTNYRNHPVAMSVLPSQVPDTAPFKNLNSWPHGC